MKLPIGHLVRLNKASLQRARSETRMCIRGRKERLSTINYGVWDRRDKIFSL